MKPIYEWLYDHYVLPKLRDVETGHHEALAAFSERAGLSKTERLRLHDLAANMRLEWGTEAFALGVRFGLRLDAPQIRPRKSGWLLDFLP